MNRRGRVWGLAIGLAVAIWAGAVLFPARVAEASYTLTDAILKGRAWTFAALQTFNAGVSVAGADLAVTGVATQQKSDYTMTTPAQAPSAVELATGGNCTTSNTYRFYLAWGNAGGESGLSPATADLVPSVTNRQFTITRAESLPSNATHWAAFFSRASDSHATKRACGTSTTDWLPLDGSITSTTCRCSVTAKSYSTITTAAARKTTALAASGDISAGQASNVNAQGVLADDVNRLRLNGTIPLWSNDSGANFSTFAMLGNAQVVQVCKAGCTYSTVTSALASITDATSTKRYAIRIGPGNYDESFAMKSYVSLVGATTPAEVHIRATSLNSFAAQVPLGTTEVGFFNVWLSGGFTIQAQIIGGSSAGNTIYIFGSWVGNLDGTDPIRSQAAVDFGSGNTGHILHVGNSWLRGTEGAVIFAGDQNLYDHGGNLYEVDCSTFTGSTTAFQGIPGDSIRLVGGAGSTIKMLDTGTTCTAMTGIAWGSPTPDRTSYLQWGGHIEMERTNASNGSAMTAVSLATIGAANDGWLDLSGMTTNIVSAGNGALKSLQVSSDPDLSDWSVNWNGGSSRLTGSGTKIDVNNDATVAGFALNLSGVQLPNGTGGAGTINGSSTLFGNFGTALQIPNGSAPLVDATGKLAVDTTANQLLTYSGGAVRVLDPVRQECRVIFDLAATDDNFEFWMASQPVTITSVGCRCRGTCTTPATFTLEDRAGNQMTITGTNPTCATGGNSTYAAVTSGNQLVAGEGLAFDVTNTPNPATDEYTLCVTYTIDQQ